MKRALFSILFISAASLFIFQSCNQNDESGLISFGLEGFIESDQLKSAMTDAGLTEALVSISDLNGQLIYDKEPLTLYRFGDGIVTKSLKLAVGKYQLVEFMLIDSSGVIIWATPKEGSPLANLVRDPLPKDFRVAAEETTKLPVEVVRVGNHPPQDFGYVNFDIHFVNHFCLSVFYSTRCYEDWNDSILTASGTFAPVYESRLIVKAGDRILLDEPMAPGLNRYTLPVIEGYYYLETMNCHGQTSYQHRFLLKELLQHRCDQNLQPLVIHDGTDPNIYITPEELKEPSIDQGVFGLLNKVYPDSSNYDPNYFKAVVRDVYFYPYFEFDSIFYGSSPIDCHFQVNLPVEPLFISRSNSYGYFQAALEPGEYLYMVKEDNGFYIDLYISSHLPGQVKVFPNEVTKLYIHIIDCGLVY